MKIENSLYIAAPPEVVWKVTTDLERWPEWTPTVEHVRRLDAGEFRLGTAAEIKQPAMSLATWTVTDLVPGKRFTWETHFHGLHMWATHELTPVDRGTENRLRLEMRGLLVWLLWPVSRKSAAKALELENSGLKGFCESLP